MSVQEQLESGLSHHQAGRLAEAEAIYRQILAQNPDHIEAMNLLGTLAAQAGRLDAGLELMRRAVRLQPDSAQGYYNIGIALQRKGQLDEAIASYRQAIRLKPDFAEAYNNLGGALQEVGQFDEAIAACRQAIRLKPDHAGAHTNLGNVLTDMGQPDEAIACYRRAVQLKPDLALAHNNLGNALKDVGQLDEAIATCQQAVRINPDYAEAHWNLALALLMRGDFERGLAEYEWRWKVKSMWVAPAFSQPQWWGENLGGRTILLFPEQGSGDAIQFVRYVPLVARRGGRVIIACQPELARLFERLPDVAAVVVSGQPIPPFDVQCSLVGLPRIFATDLNSIPADTPYLTADPTLVEQWSGNLGPTGGPLRVAIAWAGSPRFKANRTRSLNLQQLAPLAAAPGVKFYSLQKGPAGEQAKNPPVGMELVDLGPELNDFADTAAVMSLMDLIITTDTAVPHLAGALARPVWVMLQRVPDWRWLLERDDSPWYPTMRLFRQSSRGDWDTVIRQVVDALSLLTKNRA
ncbi:MAG: tetratricopeptide repeat-containing glycosyltransferase family protein [Tepidisphaeraceae bacterium]